MPSNWQVDRTRLFPPKVLTLAQAIERKYHIAACITLAQWACESDYGRRMIGRANPFGIKWRAGCGFPPIDVTTHEVIAGGRVKVIAQFIDFPNLDAAFDYRAKLLTNPRGPYGKCLPLIGDWPAYLVAVAGIYATDPQYAATLRAIIDRYHLQDLNLPKSDGAA